MSSDVLDILRKYEFKRIVQSGENYSTACLWHTDKNPSFSVNMKTGAWQCFSCGSAGPHLVSLIARLEHCSDKEAARKLHGGEDSNKHYERIADWARNLTLEKVSPPDKPFPKIPEDMVLVPWRHSPDAVAWLENNRIRESTADSFGLSYCTEGYYRGYMAVPVNDLQGAFYTYEFRRVVGHGIGGKKVIYPLHSQLGSVVYNLDRLPDGLRRVALVEGAKDVWSLDQAGGFAVSCFGTHVNNRHIQALLSKGVDEIGLLFDGDKAGQEASKKVGDKLENWFGVKRHQCPPGLDPNDCRMEVLRGLVEAIFAR